MRIYDFRKADCRLFRTPPVDLTDVKEGIENAIMEAWRNQNSAQGIVDQILDDSKIIQNLSSQIRENLAFQRKVQLDKIKLTEKERTSQYQKEQNSRLESFQQAMGQEIQTRQQTAYQKEAELTARSKTYDATQASLEETRRKIRERMDALGGIKTAEKILEINDLLLDETPKTKGAKKEEKTGDSSAPNASIASETNAGEQYQKQPSTNNSASPNQNYDSNNNQNYTA
jgi:hypothetical protein